MNRRTVQIIMEKSDISVEEAMILKEFLPEIELSEENWYEPISTLLSEKIDEVKDDLTAFKLVAIKRGLTFNYKFDLSQKAFEDDFEKEIEEEDDEYLENRDPKKWLSSVQKKKLLKMEEEILTKNEDELVKDLVDFTLETYPEIFENKNSFLQGQAIQKWYSKIGATNSHAFSKEVSEKLRAVTVRQEVEVMERIFNYEKENLDKYLKSYLEWAEQNNIKKHLKQNILLFQKQKGLKLLNPTVDEIKKLANQ